MIIVTVRTRDEEHRIGEFCQSYRDADKILVADGGSIDNTVEIAKCYKNVEVRHFTERVELQNGYWRNPDYKHINFLIKWAKEYNPSWIIFDDCDCRPNYLLKKDYRSILAETKNDFIMVTRIYLWGVDKHFPNMSQPITHGQYKPSLWAWKGELDFEAVDNMPHFTFKLNGVDVNLDYANTRELMPPYSLLHFSWDDRQRVDNKITMYMKSGLIPNMSNPEHSSGPMADLEGWMKE